MASPTERRWGFMIGGRFIEVPKTPLRLAGLAPPVTVGMADGTLRTIIEEPLRPSDVQPEGGTT